MQVQQTSPIHHLPPTVGIPQYLSTQLLCILDIAWSFGQGGKLEMYFNISQKILLAQILQTQS